MTEARKGQFVRMMTREEFRDRFHGSFGHPHFGRVADAMNQVEEVAWDVYINSGKTKATHPAGPGYADPGYELSDEWRETRKRLLAAEARQKDPATPPRVLLICGADRNDGTCPGEMSKTFRLTRIAAEVLEAQGVEADVLDLSRLVSDYDWHIHPCKGCVSTAMPLCHWPCSCYPNHALRQTNDWMGEIYEKWVAAHGIIILTPVYWYQSPSALKLMIDRLVCADGGNPDPTTTSGKDTAKAKALEEAGWSYPKHLAGRTYGLVVHGDVAGIEGNRRALSDWLDWMGLVDAGTQARLDRYIGYYDSYARSHETLDRDLAVQEEVRNVARAVSNAVTALRADRLAVPDRDLQQPRPK
ncbi:MAG TPA: flavodoxin family protein [Noviherbaspirillum sp.]|jgi:multimeric flavodoxin WrbA|uniref:flavodoxin family protein n=1 Tax=Noviherbaspirillum sp. TaxID=1926288 RepID=UPI002F959D6F